MDSLQRLRVLSEVAQRGSFSAAAEALNYTQPAVSKQIAALEREAGFALVVRGMRPVRLTEAGETLARHGQAVLERLAEASAELEAIAALETGRLRIGTFSSAGATIVVQAIAEFRRKHGGVTLTMREAGPEALVHAVKAGEMDLAVIFDFPMFGQNLGAGLDSHHLLDDPAELLVSNSHRLARRKHVSFADLRDEQWLFHGTEHPAHRLLTASCMAAGFQPNIIFEVNDCEMIQALVAAGVGISLLPRLAAHPLHPGVTLKHLNDGYSRRVAAVRLSQAQTTSADAFLELLRKYGSAYPRLSAPARR